VANCLYERDTTLYLQSLALFGQAFWEVSHVYTLQLVLTLHSLQPAVVSECLHEQDTTLYLHSLAPFGEAFWEVSQVCTFYAAQFAASCRGMS
jgi:hypothetical protein